MVISLERDADLHMAQLMPLSLTVSCFSKIQIGFTFLVPAHLGSPGKGPLNGCVYLVTGFSALTMLVGHHEVNLPCKKSTDEVLVWLYVGSKVKTIYMVQLISLPPHHLLLH